MAADLGQTPSQLIVCRTSGLAVIAFALSLLSISISAGVAAIVLGVLALRRINRSSQMLRGRGLAEAAIVLPILIGVPLFLLAWKGNTHIAPSELSCGANLSSIGKAMLLYANDHDDQFPTPSRWCDLLVSTQQVELRRVSMPRARAGAPAMVLSSGVVSVPAASVDEWAARSQ